jgi:hypothetical protein
MKKYLVLGLVVGVLGAFAINGYAASVFKIFQGGTGVSSFAGGVVMTNGTTLIGSSTPTFGAFTATTTASSTVVNLEAYSFFAKYASTSWHMTVQGSSSVQTISRSLRIGNLVSCNTIDSDASGNLLCGTDEQGGGATAGFIVNATGTPGQFAVFSALNTLTSTSTLNISQIDATSTILASRFPYASTTAITTTASSSLADIISTALASFNRLLVTGAGTSTKLSGGLEVTNGILSGVATSTFFGLESTNGLRALSLKSCDTIDTDTAGNFKCGTDATGGGGGAGFIVNATSTLTGQVGFFSGLNSLVGSSTLFWDNTLARLGIGTSTPSAPLKVVGRISSQPQFDCPVLINTVTAVVADQLGSATLAPTLCNGNMGWDMLGTTDGRIPAVTAALDNFVASGTPPMQLIDVAYTAPNNGGTTTSEGGVAISQALLGSATSSGGIAMEMFLATPTMTNALATTSFVAFAGFTANTFVSTTSMKAWYAFKDSCMMLATTTTNWQLQCRSNGVYRGVDTGIATTSTPFKVLLSLNGGGFSAFFNNSNTAAATIPLADVPADHLRAVIGAGTLAECASISGGAARFASACGISTAKGTNALNVGQLTIWSSDW